MASPTRIRGTASMVRWPLRRADRCPTGYSPCFGLDIGDMNRSPVEDGTSGDYLTRQGQLYPGRGSAHVGDEAEKVAVHLKIVAS